MALPGYDKTKRRQSFEQLPKDAYVLKILNAVQEKNRRNDGSHITIAFDIAEGEYKDFYRGQYDARTDEDKKWPNDALFRLNVPDDDSPSYVWTNWNSFFSDLEDSNAGFAFDGDLAKLKGKLIGGKFMIEQSEYNGTVYDHTRLRWSCVADDVRNGKAGKLPNDKIVKPAAASSDEFMDIPSGSADEIPF